MKPLGQAPVCAYCGSNNLNSPPGAPYHLCRGTVLAERYLIGDVLGEGGFGITYIGLDVTLGKRVAVKEFYPSGAANRFNERSNDVLVTQGKENFFEKGVSRFLFEAKNVAAFSAEDGVVDVLDYFEENGTAYIVMEYLEGKNLKDYVAENGVFQPEELISLMQPVMRSLKVMHAQGVIHRDISPDNIMYTKNGSMKLMDFGSARYFTNEEREMSVVLKQGYAPEEQYRRNGKQGPFTDVYALCATIYSCVTGIVPADSLDRLAQDTLQPPSRLGVRISPQQESALMHGLALLAENRTPDMDTLIRELTERSGEMPVNMAGFSQSYRQQPQQQMPQLNPNQPGYGAPARNQKTQLPYPPQRQPMPPVKPQNKSNKAVVIAIILTVVAVLAVGGVVAALLISNNSGGDDNTASSEASATVETASVAQYGTEPTTDPAATAPATTVPPTTVAPTTVPPTTVPPTTVPPTTAPKKNYTESEIDSVAKKAGQDFSATVGDKGDFWFESASKKTGKYAYVKDSRNYWWIATPNDTLIDDRHGGEDIKKTWYFYDDKGSVYFILDYSTGVYYRVYVDNGQAVRCQVGDWEEGQKTYDLNDGGFPSSICESLIKDADDAFTYVKTNP